jgi:hypothetical protein
LSSPVRAIPVFAFLVILAAASCANEPPPPPTELDVEVLDARTLVPIAGAMVIVRGESPVATDPEGRAVLELAPGLRGFRVQAAGYLSAPGPREGLEAIVAPQERTQRRILLEPRLPATEPGHLEGLVTHDGAAVEGALVVATSIRAFAAYTDVTGRFRMLGLDPNLYAVQAFIAGHGSTRRANIEVSAGATTRNVDLALTAIAGGEAGGSLLGETTTTSVAIAHPATRELIPGLVTRATTGEAWTIAGIPEGTFEVVAGLEPDGATLDPQAILEAGPPMITIEDQASRAIDLRFVRAIRPIFPAEGEEVDAPPTFEWPPVEGASRYVVELRNASGQVIWGGFDAHGNPIAPILAPATSVAYDGPTALDPGARHVWRVFAARDVTTGQLFELIAASEELDGTFRVTR